MADLKLARGYVIYPGREPYSLGRGVTVLPAEASSAGRPASRACDIDALPVFAWHLGYERRWNAQFRSTVT